MIAGLCTLPTPSHFLDLWAGKWFATQLLSAQTEGSDLPQGQGQLGSYTTPEAEAMTGAFFSHSSLAVCTESVSTCAMLVALSIAIHLLRGFLGLPLPSERVSVGVLSCMQP